jgi:hypothetical protein
MEVIGLKLIQQEPEMRLIDMGFGPEPHYPIQWEDENHQFHNGWIPVELWKRLELSKIVIKETPISGLTIHQIRGKVQK